MRRLRARGFPGGRIRRPFDGPAAHVADKPAFDRNAALDRDSGGARCDPSQLRHWRLAHRTARQRQAGYTRVTVTVPTGHIETIKTIARFLRNGTVGPNTVESVMEWLEGGLRAEYEAFDDWVAAGEPD